MQSRGISGFRGPAYQKGHGLGAMFKRLFKWAIPIIQKTRLLLWKEYSQVYPMV